MGINIMAVLRAKMKRAEPEAATEPYFKPPEMVAGVAPRDAMALDSVPGLGNAYAYANMYCSHERFVGYPALAQLTQKPEFRMLSEKTAAAMVRKWVEFKSKGEDDKTEKIAFIESEMERLGIRELFGECAKNDGFFGRCQLFVDLGEHSGPELETPMLMDKAKLYGRLRKFKLIEAMYTYPADYRADNPMADSYYNPQSWFVMGQKVHSSRLLLFISRPLPDILKPAYNFGGMSMSQLATPYVENWLQTRRSVNKMISNFSVLGLKTNMATVLNGDNGDDLMNRAELYNAMRDNQGLFAMDKDTEDMFKLDTSLTTLDSLQAQSQEHMSSISSIPLMVLFGISPTGLNASSEGEIRVWYDFIRDMQQVLFRDNLQKVSEIIQLSNFGEVDPDITFEFVPLYEMSELEVMDARKRQAETDQIYFDMGAVSPTEIRDRLAQDPDSGYSGLQQMPPELPEEPQDDETAPGAGEDDNAKADSSKPGKSS